MRTFRYGFSYTSRFKKIYIRHRAQLFYYVVLDIPTFYLGNIIGYGVVV